MSNRHLGVVSIERFLSVERYRQSHEPPSTHRPPMLGPSAPGHLVRRERWRSSGTSGKV